MSGYILNAGVSGRRLDDKMGGRMVARTPTTGGRQKMHERKNMCQNIPLVFFNSQKLQEGNIFFIISVCVSVFLLSLFSRQCRQRLVRKHTNQRNCPSCSSLSHYMIRYNSAQ